MGDPLGCLEHEGEALRYGLGPATQHALLRHAVKGVVDLHRAETGGIVLQHAVCGHVLRIEAPLPLLVLPAARSGEYPHEILPSDRVPLASRKVARCGRSDNRAPARAGFFRAFSVICFAHVPRFRSSDPLGAKRRSFLRRGLPYPLPPARLRDVEQTATRLPDDTQSLLDPSELQQNPSCFRANLAERRCSTARCVPIRLAGLPTTKLHCPSNRPIIVMAAA